MAIVTVTYATSYAQERVIRIRGKPQRIQSFQSIEQERRLYVADRIILSHDYQIHDIVHMALEEGEHLVGFVVEPNHS